MFKFSPDQITLLIISTVGSLISVMIRPGGSAFRNVSHFFAGIFIAQIFTNPMIKFFNIDGDYAGVVGGVLAMCGAGFARVIIEASQNPEQARGLAKILADIFDIITGRGGRP